MLRQHRRPTHASRLEKRRATQARFGVRRFRDFPIRVFSGGHGGPRHSDVSLPQTCSRSGRAAGFRSAPPPAASEAQQPVAADAGSPKCRGRSRNVVSAFCRTAIEMTVERASARELRRCAAYCPPGGPMHTLPSTSHDATVTPDNFNRAETDRYFRWMIRLAGGIGCFHHRREVMPIEWQTVVRPNRDTRVTRQRSSISRRRQWRSHSRTAAPDSCPC